MTTFTESGFRGFLSAFLPPLISRDPTVAPQQRVILMGGLGDVNFHSVLIMFMFSPALLPSDINAQQRMHGDGAGHV